jgi:nudix-type nucleoside diphosphatase (YffH/AdpP family)
VEATAATMMDSVIVRLEKAAIVRVLYQAPAFSEMFIAHLVGRTIRVEADLVDQLFNPMKPEILERQIAHAGYLTVERLRMRLTDGAEVSREVERHGDAAAVLPYDVERRSALVVRLFRAPVLEASGEEMSEEACAGMIENEDADTTARREAYEELGVDLPSLEFVARVWSSPGVSTERQSLFLAPFRSADRISDGGGVEGEHEGITIVERLLAELAADVDQGRISDGKLLTLVLALRLRRPDLFV